MHLLSNPGGWIQSIQSIQSAQSLDIHLPSKLVFKAVNRRKNHLFSQSWYWKKGRKEGNRAREHISMGQHYHVQCCRTRVIQAARAAG